MRLLECLSRSSRAELIRACQLANIRADQRADDRIRRKARSKAERVERACSRGEAGYRVDGWPIRPIR